MVIKMYGLASGLDTENLISKLLTQNRIPAMRLTSENNTLDQKKSAWSSIDSALTKLESSVETLTKRDNWRQKNATSSDSKIAEAFASTEASNGSYDLSVSTLAQSHRVASDSQTDTTSSLGLSGSFTVGGESISVGSEDSLGDIRELINDATANMAESDKVNASIIENTLVLERDATGATDISLSDDSGAILESLGVLTGSGEVKNELQQSKDLDMSVNGISIVRSQNEGLDDIVEGVTLNIEGTGDTQIDIQTDTASIESMIDDFISAYNSAMSMMESYSRVDTEDSSSSSIAPALAADSDVARVLHKSRDYTMAQNENLPDNFDQLSDIGLGTSDENNRISLIDSDKLASALTDNLEDVEDLFRDPIDGILNQFGTYLEDSVLDPLGGVTTTRQEQLDEQIERNNEQIDLIGERVQQRRELLEEQFASMEETISQMNSQLSFIQSMFGGGGSSKMFG